jgi:hypothetical protein
MSSNQVCTHGALETDDSGSDNGDPEDEDLFSDDCERNKFWMKNHYEKRGGKYQRDLHEQRESKRKDLICMQQERLKRAKLLSGYYSLQLQEMENNESNHCLPNIAHSNHSIPLRSGECEDEQREETGHRFPDDRDIKKRRRSHSRGRSLNVPDQKEHSEVYQQIQERLRVSLAIGEYLTSTDPSPPF